MDRRTVSMRERQRIQQDREMLNAGRCYEHVNGEVQGIRDRGEGGAGHAGEIVRKA